MDISKIKISGTDYTLKDAVARGEETETEGISHIEIGGVSYDCKDIVARGEGEPTENEISKVSIGGVVYQIKDIEARESVYDYYFAVYCADDESLTFYGDNTVPTEGTQYNGKTVTTVYTDFLDLGEDDPPWYEEAYMFASALIDTSFKGARPITCRSWFDSFEGTIDGLGNLDTSSVTNMERIFYGCSSLTTLDVSGFDTSSVTNMHRMFSRCSGLTAIYSDDDMFVTTAVTDGEDMFTDCTKLVGGNGTAYDSSRVDHTMAHIDTPDNEGYFTDINDKGN